MPRAKQPKKLTTKHWRETARRARDEQWVFAERAAEFGTVWACWWDKDRRHKGKELPRDLFVFCLIGGTEMGDWLNRHPDWWEIGKWDDARYAAPVHITEAGRAALANRAAYDMEPVYGGLVDPGWQAIPLPPSLPQSF